MPDFPSGLISPQFMGLSTCGPTSLCMDASICAGNAYNNGSAWPAANRGLFVPVWVEQPVTAYQMAVVVTVQSGNVDVGIFDTAGVALVRAGATAVGAAGIQLFDITNTLLLPGVYFLGMAVDNGTAAFRCATTTATILRAAGMTQMASAYSSGLVDPVTYAANATSYVPLLSASLVPTI